VPGKLLYTVDILVKISDGYDTLKFEEVEKFIAVVVNSLPATLSAALNQDSGPTCCTVLLPLGDKRSNL